jgi:hypothetical protein
MDERYDGTSRRRLLQAGLLGAGVAIAPELALSAAPHPIPPAAHRSHRAEALRVRGPCRREAIAEDTPLPLDHQIAGRPATEASVLPSPPLKPLCGGEVRGTSG